MFKHLIVPLDGSRLSESVLPIVLDMAHKLQARVTLVHVIERNAPEEKHGEPHLSEPAAAEEYLEDVERRLFAGRGIQVDRHVHKTAISDVAGSIVEHAQEFGSDLVVMCTHGHGGLRKLLFGSIAQQVTACRVSPLLLIRPKESGSTAFLSGRAFLLPLDGTKIREEALPFATRLALACKVELKLLMVVPTLSTLSGAETASRFVLPATTQEMLSFAFEDAEKYVQNLVSITRREELKLTAEVLRGDLAETIVTEAHRMGVDLIVLATTAKSGIHTFWSSSLAQKVANRTDLAILLIPARV